MPIGHGGRRTKGEVFKHMNLPYFKKERIWIQVETHGMPTDIEVPLDRNSKPIMKLLQVIERKKVLRRGQHMKYVIVKVVDGRLIQREYIA